MNAEDVLNEAAMVCGTETRHIIGSVRLRKYEMAAASMAASIMFFHMGMRNRDISKLFGKTHCCVINMLNYDRENEKSNLSYRLKKQNLLLYLKNKDKDHENGK